MCSSTRKIHYSLWKYLSALLFVERMFNYFGKYSDVGVVREVHPWLTSRDRICCSKLDDPDTGLVRDVIDYVYVVSARKRRIPRTSRNPSPPTNTDVLCAKQRLSLGQPFQLFFHLKTESIHGLHASSTVTDSIGLVLVEAIRCYQRAQPTS